MKKNFVKYSRITLRQLFLFVAAFVMIAMLPARGFSQTPTSISEVLTDGANYLARTANETFNGTTQTATQDRQDDADNLTAAVPGDIDPTFTGGVMQPNSLTGSTVRAIAIQPDGKHLIAGDFVTVNGTGRNYIVRLNADGTTDTTFDTGVGFSNSVTCIAVQPDGKIIVGGLFGSFTDLTGVNSKGSISRLNSDGSLDTNFSIGSGANGNVNSIALQADGKIIIGGDFSSIDGSSRKGVARLLSDGSIDYSFTPSTGATGGADNGGVDNVLALSNGKVIIVGRFTSYNNTNRNYIARINSDGTLDTTFNVGTGTDSRIYALALQSEGKILIGGDFFTYNGLRAKKIARINIDGSLDSFLEGSCPQTNQCNYNLNLTYQISVTTDDRIYVSDNDNYNNGANLGGGLRRFNADGSLDTNFNVPPPNTSGHIQAIQADGMILTNNSRQIPGALPNYFSWMRRYNANGGEDGTYTPVLGARGLISELLLQPDGKVVAGGYFNVANATAHYNLARFNADGTLDNTFTARVSSIYSLKMIRQPDGKIFVAGGFGTANGVTRGNVARFNADGTLDTTFNVQVGTDGQVFDAALLSDGKFLIGGNFTTYNGVARGKIVRINSDGSLDTTFDPSGVGANNLVLSIGIQPDGKMIIGGLFTTYDGIARNGIVRLNADGTLDTTFDPGTGVANVRTITVLPSGKIMITGSFTSYNGTTRQGIARLNGNGSLDTTFGNLALPTGGYISKLYIQTDGKFIVGGNFTSVGGQIRGGIARLNPDGGLDTTFGNNSNGAPFASNLDVVGMAVDEAGGKLYFGGAFTTFNNIGRGSLVRLFTGTGTPPTYSISGQITNGTNALPNVAVALSGTSSATVTTDSSGSYSFTNLVSGGNFTITPTLNGYSFNPTNRTITNLTANQTAQNFAATATPACTYTLSPTSPQSVPASGGNYTVTVTTQTGCAWTATSSANYITVTNGSGTGSGSFSYAVAANTGVARSTNLTAAGQSYVVSQAAASAGCTNGVSVSLPTTNAAKNATVIVPIVAADTTGKNITSFDADLRFDSTVIRPVAAAPTDNAGTLSSGFTITPNANTPGKLVISAFGNNALSGAGTLLNLKFEIIGNAQQAADITWQSFQFNEGTPCSTTASGRITVINGSLSGNVNYHFVASGQTAKAVSNVTLTAAGSPNVMATSNPSGAYLLTGLGGGAYTVTPTKTGDVNGISSQDAARVSQFVAGLVTLTANQQIAADATDNGTVSSQDAARISQYVAGIQVAGATGNWKFAPASRNYSSVVSDLTGENYDAILVGEVTGNWTPPASLSIGGKPTKKLNNSFINNGFDQTPNALQDVVAVTLPPNAAANAAANFTIPIISGDTTGKNITSFDMDLRWDPAVLQLQTTPVSNAGTLSQGFTITPNPNNAGRLIVSAFGNNAITGAGTLLNINFKVIGAAGATSPLTFQTFTYNEGDPAAQITNGVFRANVTTAASVIIGGRVTTTNGRGIINALVRLTDLQGATRTVSTGAFGYYRFTDVTPGTTVIISATAKRYTFSQPSQVLSLTEDAANVDFTAQ